MAVAVLSSLEPDTFLIHRALGTEARYRVLRATRDLVDVEVIEAPGLARGTRVRFTAAAAGAMGRLANATAPAPTGSRRSRFRAKPARRPATG